MSILSKYAVGTGLSSEHAQGHLLRRSWILSLGICSNLGLLGDYKYANFFVENAKTALSLSWRIEPIILPLGISFFTFTQIAFLVDAYRGDVKEANFIHYEVPGAKEARRTVPRSATNACVIRSERRRARWCSSRIGASR